MKQTELRDKARHVIANQLRKYQNIDNNKVLLALEVLRLPDHVETTTGKDKDPRR